MFGRQARLPVDLTLGTEPNEAQSEGMDYDEWVNDHWKRYKYAYDLAKEHTEAAKASTVRIAGFHGSLGPQSCHLRLQDNGLQINLQQGLLQQKCSAPADLPNGPRVTRYWKDHRKFETCVQYEDGTWDEFTRANKLGDQNEPRDEEKMTRERKPELKLNFEINELWKYLDKNEKLFNG
ncbi:Hypp6983 [Branchiostoma lanceolatum]|uniref:Hypp6983 protein n=1 Tax=Branchiostoma lanceolatum TaxID=7740 RepID=A0A8J9YWA0_BRALA|nr:Hypp6983 [Branchiostoma lanceolatum]